MVDQKIRQSVPQANKKQGSAKEATLQTLQKSHDHSSAAELPVKNEVLPEVVFTSPSNSTAVEQMIASSARPVDVMPETYGSELLAYVYVPKFDTTLSGEEKPEDEQNNSTSSELGWLEAGSWYLGTLGVLGAGAFFVINSDEKEPIQDSVTDFQGGLIQGPEEEKKADDTEAVSPILKGAAPDSESTWMLDSAAHEVCLCEDVLTVSGSADTQLEVPTVEQASDELEVNASLVQALLPAKALSTSAPEDSQLINSSPTVLLVNDTDVQAFSVMPDQGIIG